MSALPVCDLMPVRVLPLPDTAPPPEGVAADGPADRRSPRLRPDPRQGVLTLVSEHRPPTATLPRRRRPDDDFGPVATSTADLPDARTWAARLTPALLQVACGARPAPQLLRHVGADVYESLVRRHSRALRTRLASRRPVRIRAVVASHPADGVAEVSVVVDDSGRTRALALRLEGVDGRWVVTALQIG